jgi:hypothetical protein
MAIQIQIGWAVQWTGRALMDIVSIWFNYDLLVSRKHRAQPKALQR